MWGVGGCLTAKVPPCQVFFSDFFDFFCQGKNARCFMRVKTRRHKTQKLLEKLPVAGSPCTPCRASKGEKSDESQFPIRDSVESKRPPAHAFIGSSVGHLPRTEANHAPLVFFLVDKKMFCRAENFVNGFVAIFTDIGNTFKGSKNFADHIFYELKLVV